MTGADPAQDAAHQVAKDAAEDAAQRAADDVVGLYQRLSPAFRARRWLSAFFERPWIDRFADAVPAGGRVLDLGCGSGAPIARRLAERGARVTGVDSAPAMIAAARAALPSHAFVCADMRMVSSAALGQASFDGVLAWHSFFHLTQADQRALLPRLAGFCASGAPLMFTSGPRAGVAIGSMDGAPLHHASLSRVEYRRILGRAGLEILAFAPEDPATGGATIWLARRR